MKDSNYKELYDKLREENFLLKQQIEGLTTQRDQALRERNRALKAQEKLAQGQLFAVEKPFEADPK